jgi:hypothetical protein
LIGIEREDSRPVGVAPVAKLAAGIQHVNRPQEFGNEVIVRNHRAVECDLYCLIVPFVIFVGRVVTTTPSVARNCVKHAWNILKVGFDAPKAAPRDHCLLHISRRRARQAQKEGRRQFPHDLLL